MPQLFRPSSNTLSRLSVLLLALAPVGLLAVGSMISRSPSVTKVENPLPQPVAFSHIHHADELGIDCRYCHTTVETSRFAGIPDTHTCMSCHSQIWTNSPLLEPVRRSYETGQPIVWQRVNKLPEFVYFDHSIHIDRGVQCNQCHGPVQSMPMTWKGSTFAMAWCLDCHRNPDQFLYQDSTHPELSPREQVFNLYMKYQRREELSGPERRLIQGHVGKPGVNREEGRRLVDELHIDVQQLSDCWICHR
jgi:hypothetical protein